MSIVKIKKRKERFAVISMQILENEYLSYKAKGMLCYLLSRPDGWTIRTKDLENRSTDGKDSVKSGLRELRSAGYAEIVQERNAKGHLLGKSYVIHETPKQPKDGKTDFRENRLSGNPTIGKPVDIVKTNPNKNQLPNNNQKEQGLFEEQPSFPLLEFFKDLPKTFSPLVLQAEGQPSAKTVQGWKAKFGEEQLLEEIYAFERWLQAKKKEKKFPKIKSLSKKLSNWLNNKYIANKEERELLEVWRTYWKENVPAPFRFDFFKSGRKASEDRKALSSVAEYYAQTDKNPQEEWNRVLRNLPDFWKAQRLSIIVRNLAKITTEIDKAPSGGNSKSNCATISSMDYI